MLGARGVVLQLTAMAVLAGGARAQGPMEPAREWHLGVGGVVSAPQGDFAQSVEAAGGLALNVRYNPSGGAGFGLRADIGFVRYGSNTQSACFSVTVGCRVQLDVVTANDILLLSIGPEWLMPGRGPVRLHLGGGVGLAHFFTHSYVTGVDETHEDFGNTTNFKDTSLALRGGGGILVRLVRGPTPVSLDVAAYYHRNGVAEYLTEVDIEDLPGGDINMSPRRGDTNFLSFRLGIVVAF